MAPLTALNTGCLMEIMSGMDIEKPILQILGSKKISNSEGSERYRILVSDGKYSHSFAMLGTQLNEMMIDGRLSDNTIVCLDKYITSSVNKSDKAEKKVLILLALDVLHSGVEVGTKIGSPTPISDKTSQVSELNTQQKSITPASTSMPGTSHSLMGINARSTVAKPGPSIDDGGLNATVQNQLTHPIASLSPYQNKWVIKARVTSKTPIKIWNNQRGEGKLFSMDLLDDSGEIRATAFQQQCDRFFDMIEVDKVYYISRCQLKPANKKFTSLKNDYEMSLMNDTVIQECKDAIDDTPMVQYNIVPIAQIANMEPNSMIDVLGVCTETGDIIQFTARSSGRELKKREITLVDSSNASVTLTLWGTDAEKFDGYTQPVLLLKNVRVTEFGGGKSLSLVSSSAMKMNPDMAEGHRLRGWFDNGGTEKVASNVSARTGAAGSTLVAPWKTFHESKVENAGSGDKPDYFQCLATINLVRTTNPFYMACSQPNCNKKVIENGNGAYRCEKCAVDAFTFKYRLLLNISIADWTSNRWVTCFSDLGEKLLGQSAQELGELYNSDKESCEQKLSSINFQSYMFKLRAKAETYADNLRTKLTVLSVSRIQYLEYNKYLVTNIQNFSGVRKQE